MANQKVLTAPQGAIPTSQPTYQPSFQKLWTLMLSKVSMWCIKELNWPDVVWSEEGWSVCEVVCIVVHCIQCEEQPLRIPCIMYLHHCFTPCFIYSLCGIYQRCCGISNVRRTRRTYNCSWAGKLDYNLRTLIKQAQLGHQIFKNWSQKGLVVVVVGHCEWWYSGFFIDCVCDQWLGRTFRIVFVFYFIECVFVCVSNDCVFCSLVILCKTLCAYTGVYILCVTNGCLWWFISTFGTIQDPVTRKKLLTVIKIIVIIVANKFIIITT